MPPHPSLQPSSLTVAPGRSFYEIKLEFRRISRQLGERIESTLGDPPSTIDAFDQAPFRILAEKAFHKGRSAATSTRQRDPCSNL
jgi:hypothetical protein